MAGRRFPRLPGRGRLTDGIEVKARDGGVEIDLHVVVEYGLNLAEVAATVRNRVAYEVERQTGLHGRLRRGAHRRRQALVVNLDRAREIARAALANLEANRQRIDDLNVYPVPDGDTGTNLTLTVRAIVESLEKSTAEGHEAVAHELSRAALMGARGNSGVIFSQIVRGFADVLGEQDTIDEPMVARAFRSASDAAYRAVRRPVEGTMLTVIREMAEAAESPEARDLDRLDLLTLIVARGEEALARTPDLLAVLKEAGVVDAGGAGLLEIIRGVRAAVAGEVIPEAARRGGLRVARGTAPGALRVPLLHGVRDRGRCSRRRRARGRARAAG